jgi:peptidyl-prolyl cis-trans isomerase C
VARVNGRPILRRDFDLAVQLQFQARPDGSVGIEELRVVRERVLDQLIDNELLYQQAVKSRHRVPEAEIEAEMKRLTQGMASPDEFARTLSESQVSEDEFREQVRRTLVVARFVDAEVAAQVTLGVEDLRRYYDQNPSEMMRPEAIRIGQIMVRVPSGASLQARAAARQKIEEILKELRAGSDFAEMARKHSDGPEAGRGGDSGLMSRGGGPPPIERVAFQMKPGEISDVIETRIGFHIIRVGDTRPAGPVPFEEAREAIRARLAARERDQAIRAYVEKLRDGARVERTPLSAPVTGRSR